jgi:hypothetical protein
MHFFGPSTPICVWEVEVGGIPINNKTEGMGGFGGHWVHFHVQTLIGPKGDGKTLPLEQLVSPIHN